MILRKGLGEYADIKVDTTGGVRTIEDILSVAIGVHWVQLLRRDINVVLEQK